MSKYLLFLVFPFFLLTSHSALSQGCTCTNCPQYMPDLFSGNFFIDVMNASNPTLGQNGQGVCGVIVHWNHTAICDLSMTLTSPSGQSVILVGPIGQFCTSGGNAGTDWDITFVPCGSGANPDPGFAATWNNNQPWGGGNSYSGSYYPYQGCLQNFMGSVNGIWTLNVTDGQANDTGNLLDYQIIFCDPSGINCFTCAANAGSLDQADVMACQGTAALNLSLPPTFTPVSTTPPSSDYSYAYVIAGAGGIIQAIASTPDMTGYPAGTYTICGLSYLTANADLIPTPNGSLTLTQLHNQLNSSQPPFCGKTTTNCVNVTVYPKPPDEEEFQEICAPACYTFHTQSFCQTGDYVLNLTSTQGCHYTAELHLTVHQPSIKNINEIICPGGCSTNPSFPNACGPGTFQTTLHNIYGCDSTVTLTLTVMSIHAAIATPGMLSCSQSTLLLQGTGSTTGAGTSYLWTPSNGGHIVGPNTTINVTIDQPGTYKLKVCRSQGGASCCDSTSVTVTGNQATPGMPTITGPATLCQGQTQTYSVGAITGATGYTWTVPAGVTISSGQGTTSITVVWNSPNGGNVCATANNACGSSTPACLTVQVNNTVSPATPQGQTVVCTGTTASYKVSSLPGAVTYQWTITPAATILSGQGTDSIAVKWTSATSYTVCVTASNTCGPGAPGCLNVTVNAQPVAQAGADGSVCGSVFNLSATPSVNGSTGTWGTVSGPGTVSFSNAGAPATTATASQTGVYQFVWTETNATCTSKDTVTVHFNPSPAAGQIQPACDNTNQHYTITFPITGGTAPYTVPGGTVTAGTFTSAPILSGAPYSFIITDANGCMSQTISGIINCNCTTNAGQMNLQPLSACPGGSVTAQGQGAQLDANDVGAYFLHTNPGPSLGTVLAENTTGTFTFQPGMTYGTTYYISFAAANNLNGLPDLSDPCLSVAQGEPVVFYNNPVALAGADTSACGLSVQLSGNTGAGTGSWSVASTPAGGTATIATPQSSATGVTADLFGTYTFSYTVNNNGCMGSDTIAVSFQSSPAAGAVARVCDGSNQNYTVGFAISGGTGPYTVSGAPATGASFTSAPVPSGNVYNFIITDANGCASPPVTGSFNCQCATNAGLMDLTPLSACAGDSIAVQPSVGQMLDGNDTIGYVLHTGSGPALGTVLSQNNTGIFSFGNGMTYGTTYYVSQVAGNNVNGSPDQADPCFSVAAGQPVVFYQYPVADAGTDNATCSNSISLNATGLGTWSIVSTPAGGSLSFSDVHNPTAVANPSGPGIYTLAWEVVQHQCADTNQVVIQFYDNPVSNSVLDTCDNIAENYMVSFNLTGGTPPYLVNGTPIAGNSFTSPLLPAGQNYSYAVKDQNGCTMPNISGTHTCQCITRAGTMVLQTLTACEGDSVTAQANPDQHLDGNDVSAYILHSTSGATLGQVFGQNTTGTFGFQAGMTYGQTYYISRIAGTVLNGAPNQNDPCFKISPGQPVVFLKNPTPTAGLDISGCGPGAQLDAMSSGFNGTWTQVSGPGTAGFTALHDPASLVTTSTFGTYVFRWTEVNGVCTGMDDVSVTFFQPPTTSGVVETCNNTNTGYTVSFTVNGGTAPYTDTGAAGTFTGNVFTSNQLTNSANYSIVVTDANGCQATPVSGGHHCNCTTNAGTMAVTPAVFCSGQPATAVWNNNATLDGDDGVQYILHDQSGATLGNVLATSNQPTFNFGPGLQTGVVYYISAIAGNSAAGVIDVNDPCLNIAPGVPVQWKPIPTTTLTGDATICNGGSSVLNFSGTGVYPLQVIYSNGTNNLTQTISGQQPVAVTVSPAVTTVYTLISVADGTSPVCSATVSSTTTVTVNQPVHAGTAHAPLELCVGTNLPVQLTNLITGADFGGQWSETSALPSLPGAFTATTGTFNTGGQPAGTYTFKYLVSAAAPCPNQESTVTVILDPLPVADAGPDKAINCNQAAVALGGPNTSAGAGYVYNWTSNGTSVGTTTQIFTGNPGDYTLQVTSPAGCIDSDLVHVALDNEQPKANLITVDSVRCFGEKNGKISLDSVTSAHKPVLFSLNGGPFGTSSLFASLPPGKYAVTLQDANGCEWTTDTLVITEPPQLLVDLGSTIKATLGDSVILNALITVPFSSIHSVFWNPVNDTLNKNTLTQHFLPFESQQVTIKITDKNGCVTDGSVLVIVSKTHHVFIPNIFKPSSLINDQLLVYGGRDVAEVESFQIYDRWGNQVFEVQHFQASDPTKGWNGKYKGQDVASGVFAYYAVVRFINGEKVVFKGDVTVLR
jgi:subtilisin-like proprotein convertase family protein